MRPKKVLIYFSYDDNDLSVTSFALSNAGYLVLKASSPSDVTSLLCLQDVALIVLSVDDMLSTANFITAGAKVLSPGTPVVILGTLNRTERHLADAMLSKKTTSMSELLERIKVMSARKRGRPTSRSIPSNLVTA